MKQLQEMRQHIVNTLKNLAADEKKTEIQELLYYTEFFIHAELLYYFDYIRKYDCLPSEEDIKERLKSLQKEDEKI